MDFPKPPPFANKARAAVSLAKDLSGSKQKPKPPKTSTKVHSGSTRRGEASGSRQEKRKQPDGPPPKDSSAPPKAPCKDKAVAFSTVGNTFAKLVEEHVIEEDLKTWSELEGPNVDFEMNTLVSQLCYLQLSRSNELQRQSALLKATKDENKNLQHSLSSLNEELASLRKDLVIKADEAAENERFWKKANADLVEAANKKTQELSDSLRLATETLKDAQRDFEEQSAESEANADRAYAEGTVNFMKSFMEKIPDFDWTPFGSDTVVYAAEMKAQLEEEAKLAKQSEAVQVMEEAAADSEAKPTGEDGDDVRIVEDPVNATDAA